MAPESMEKGSAGERAGARLGSGRAKDLERTKTFEWGTRKGVSVSSEMKQG